MRPGPNILGRHLSGAGCAQPLPGGTALWLPPCGQFASQPLYGRTALHRCLHDCCHARLQCLLRSWALPVRANTTEDARHTTHGPVTVLSRPRSSNPLWRVCWMQLDCCSSFASTTSMGVWSRRASCGGVPSSTVAKQRRRLRRACPTPASPFSSSRGPSYVHGPVFQRFQRRVPES